MRGRLALRWRLTTTFVGDFRRPHRAGRRPWLGGRHRLTCRRRGARFRCGRWAGRRLDSRGLGRWRWGGERGGRCGSICGRWFWLASRGGRCDRRRGRCNRDRWRWDSGSNRHRRRLPSRRLGGRVERFGPARDRLRRYRRLLELGGRGPGRHRVLGRRFGRPDISLLGWRRPR